MRGLACLLGTTALLVQLANATSEGVGEHQCPICERELKTTHVMRILLALRKKFDFVGIRPLGLISPKTPRQPQFSRIP